MNPRTPTAPIPWVSIAHIAILAIAAGCSVYACETAIAHYVQLDHASRAAELHQWVGTLSATGVNIPLLAAAAVFMVGLPVAWLSHRSSFTFPYHTCDPTDLQDLNIIDETFCGAHSSLNETLVGAARLHERIHAALVRCVFSPLYHYQTAKNWPTLIRITLLSAIIGATCYASSGLIVHYSANLQASAHQPDYAPLLQYLVDHNVDLHILAASTVFASYVLLTKPGEFVLKLLVFTATMLSMFMFLATAATAYAVVLHNPRLTGHSTKPGPKNLEDLYPKYDPAAKLSDNAVDHQLPTNQDTSAPRRAIT